MSGARACCGWLVLALSLGTACTVTVHPIKNPPADGGPGDSSGRCTGRVGVDADPGGSLSQGLLVYYPCEQASGTALPDQSGNNRNATLASAGTGAGVGYRFAAGRVGEALYLDSATQGHVVLPSGLLQDACEATIATWIRLNSQSNWQRIWTFSVDLTVFMYLTTRNADNGVVRSGITLDGTGPERQFLDGPSLPTGVWTHVALVLGPSGMVLYVNGAQAAADPAVTLRPADLGLTPFDYIGRSNFPRDPYLDGDIDEFRIYDRALSAAEILALSNAL
jgi:uncharacterized protein